MYVDLGKQQPESKHFAPCQSKSLHSGYVLKDEETNGKVICRYVKVI